jgi:hypothetical protein
MQNSPDTPYFVYLYVFTCEKCNRPHLETFVVETVPQDELDRTAAEWYCENCNSPQSTALYRGAVYAKWLLVNKGKCSERRSTGNVFPN